MIKLYYSIDNILEDYDILNFLQDFSNNSLSEYKSELWLDNNIKYGEINYILEIKYDKKINYYTAGKIILLLDNKNICIEIDYENIGCKMEFLSNNFSVNSTKFIFQNIKIDKIMNVSFEFNIKDNNIYGTILLNEL